MPHGHGRFLAAGWLRLSAHGVARLSGTIRYIGMREGHGFGHGEGKSVGLMGAGLGTRRVSGAFVSRGRGRG